MSGRTFDRRVEFDERSRDYPIRTLVSDELVGRSWPCYARLDQGRNGACVGFAWTHELAAVPAVVPGLNAADAQALYKEAQTLDQWPGEAYEGTSVLAGAKVVQGRGLITEYRWAFGIDDLLRAISHAGPAVVGIPWLDSMFTLGPDGVLDCSGAVSGGHAVLARGLLLKKKGGPYVRIRNSWGPDWGMRGDALFRVPDLERLLGMDGEACVPVVRRTSP